MPELVLRHVDPFLFGPHRGRTVPEGVPREVTTLLVELCPLDELIQQSIQRTRIVAVPVPGQPHLVTSVVKVVAGPLREPVLDRGDRTARQSALPLVVILRRFLFRDEHLPVVQIEPIHLRAPDLDGSKPAVRCHRDDRRVLPRVRLLKLVRSDLRLGLLEPLSEIRLDLIAFLGTDAVIALDRADGECGFVERPHLLGVELVLGGGVRVRIERDVVIPLIEVLVPLLAEVLKQTLQRFLESVHVRLRMCRPTNEELDQLRRVFGRELLRVRVVSIPEPPVRLLDLVVGRPNGCVRVALSLVGVPPLDEEPLDEVFLELPIVVAKERGEVFESFFGCFRDWRNG